MEAWVEHLITQSLEWALFAVALVTFLESLAVRGAVTPWNRDDGKPGRAGR